MSSTYSWEARLYIYCTSNTGASRYDCGFGRAIERRGCRLFSFGNADTHRRIHAGLILKVGDRARGFRSRVVETSNARWWHRRRDSTGFAVAGKGDVLYQKTIIIQKLYKSNHIYNVPSDGFAARNLRLSPKTRPRLLQSTSWPKGRLIPSWQYRVSRTLSSLHSSSLWYQPSTC